MKIKNYYRMARLDHWFKNILMLPGFALAIVLTNTPLLATLPAFAVAFFSTCLLASANYVLNEWLDAAGDRHHPLKRNRPSAVGVVDVWYVYLTYGLLVAAGLSLASLLTQQFLWLSLLFLVSAWVYNVKPLRTKDRVYLDVLTESLNNPLRLLLGWSAVLGDALPPSSILLAYWMGGAFLMAVKRYAEFRFIGDEKQAALYRQSFFFYNENKLLLSAFFYALSSAFFLGVFLIKYRVEFLLTFPLFAVLFVWYLAIGMKPQSVAQRPERLYREVNFLLYLAGLCLVVTLLFFVDLPWLQILTERVDY